MKEYIKKFKEKLNKKKDNKKKGFTLIELLAVIVILAIVLVVTIPSVIGSINSAKEKQAENAIKIIEDYMSAQYALCDSGIADFMEEDYNSELFDDECFPTMDENKILESSGISKDIIDLFSGSINEDGKYIIASYSKGESLTGAGNDNSDNVDVFKDNVENLSKWIEKQKVNPTNEKYNTWINLNGNEFPVCSSYNDLADCFNDTEGNVTNDLLSAVGLNDKGIQSDGQSSHSSIFYNEETNKVCVVLKLWSYYNAYYGSVTSGYFETSDGYPLVFKSTGC